MSLAGPDAANREVPVLWARWLQEGGGAGPPSQVAAPGWGQALRGINVSLGPAEHLQGQLSEQVPGRCLRRVQQSPAPP